MATASRISQRSLSRMLATIESAINQALAEISTLDDLSEAERNSILLLQAAGVSIHSMRLLLDSSFMGARDAFGVSRSICESCVNASYLLVEPGAADRATAYSLQRFYRDMSRDVTLAGVTLKVNSAYSVDLSGIDGLESALSLFTRSSGGEIREWSGKSIDQKIELISQSNRTAGTSLAISRLLVYGASSEILHGSPYGVMYFWTGAGNRPVDGSDAKRKMMIHYLTSITASAAAIEGLFALWAERNRASSLLFDFSWIYPILQKLTQLHVEEEAPTHLQS